ncbi:MAG TPA: FtsX-like permease family protein [Prolixibacteraceae bacterium]|nr:FtsX-like permease family protein [Prolixibacteraceae bacterium]
MKTALFIAKRYLISRKSVNVINLISGISVAGVTVGTFALVAILSVFNGMETTIKSMFSSFDPQIKITASLGKSFTMDKNTFDAVARIPGIRAVTPVIEEDAMLRYDNRQYVATVKGVPLDYPSVSRLDSTFITGGKFLLESENIPLAVVGQGVAYYLSVGLRLSDPIHIYALKKGTRGRPDISNAFIHSTIYAGGIFQNQQEIDSKYILVPIDFARELFQMNDRVSSAEITLLPGYSEKEIKEQVAKLLGSTFTVRTQFEQHELFYKVMQSEKWAIFFILGFVLVIASFNILGSLSMLIIDKKSDIIILQSMGASQKLIRTIFLFEGWLISLIGAAFGLILGIFVCWLQMKYGLLKIPGNEGSFIFSSYPVEVRVTDLIYIFLLVSGIGFLAAWYPIRFISGKYLNG